MQPGSKIDKAVTAAALLAGLAAIGFGLWQIYPPVAWIFGGVVAIAIAGDLRILAREKASAKP